MTKKQKSFLVVYFLLLILCVFLLVISNYLDFAVRDKVLPIAADGFKLVLGALIGALSTMLGISSNSEGGR